MGGWKAVRRLWRRRGEGGSCDLFSSLVFEGFGW